MPLLNIFGELETFTTEHLYPLRYIITPILIAILLAGLYIAYRAGAHLWIWRHQLVSAAVAIPLVLVSYVGVDYFVSPLWERSTLVEASPLETISAASEAPAVSTPETQEADGPAAIPQSSTEMTDSAEMTDTAGSGAAAPPSPAESPEPAFEPSTLYSGSFVGSDDFHFGRGDALIIETEPGKYVLRFENFSVRNGPDLFVYLSQDPTGETVDEALNLGDLKATDGAFNYEIPPEVDVSAMRSAVVWCREFAVLFAHAELSSP